MDQGGKESNLAIYSKQILVYGRRDEGGSITQLLIAHADYHVDAYGHLESIDEQD